MTRVIRALMITACAMAAVLVVLGLILTAAVYLGPLAPLIILLLATGALVFSEAYNGMD